MNPIDLAWLIILLPLAGATACGAMALAQIRRGAHWPAIATVAGSAAISIIILIRFIHQPDLHYVRTGYDWLPLGQSWLAFKIQIDGLTAVMLATVTPVSLLVIIYSRGYMADDPGYSRFFALLPLFVAAMCTLVLAGNFLLLYLGWEAVGLCSYLLIGFWYRRPSAANAAFKAFVVNRIGDLGFAVGILLIYLNMGTLDYDTVFARAPELTPSLATTIALLLFCGAIGKSAQLPLYVWLPDAMEGPTPVSALIHAATMVTAGVYMVARCGVVFTASPVALAVVATVGAVTAFYAATIALAQYDIKRILAYSTISQLGYMFLAVGLAVPVAGIFHLATHAFFKALLFLAAGSVMHAMADVVDIRRIGGLRRLMPVTYWTCLVGCLALAGLFPFAGYWSKDPIILSAWQSGRPMLGALATLTAVLTTFYIFRMFFRTFHGPCKVPDAVDHAHESGHWMCWPMIILAVGAAVLGFALGSPADHGLIDRILAPSLIGSGKTTNAADPHLNPHALTGGLTAAALLTIAFTWLVYRNGRGITERLAEKTSLAAKSFQYVHTLLNRKYFVDEVYDAVAVNLVRGGADGCDEADRSLVDGLLAAIVAVPRGLARSLRLLQQGALQGYALATMIVLAVMLLIALKVLS